VQRVSTFMVEPFRRAVCEGWDLEGKGFLVGRREAERLAQLYHYDILDTPPDAKYDRITKLTRDIFGADIAVISLVSLDREWVLSADGPLEVREIPRQDSFCQHVIQDTAPSTLVVCDAQADSRFAQSLLVTGPPWVRFYAGAALVGKGELRLGALSVISCSPRYDFNMRKMMQLEELAKIVMPLIEQRADQKMMTAAAVGNVLLNMSQMLRTPLTSLQMAVDHHEDLADDEDVRVSLDSVCKFVNLSTRVSTLPVNYLESYLRGMRGAHCLRDLVRALDRIMQRVRVALPAAEIDLDELRTFPDQGGHMVVCHEVVAHIVETFTCLHQRAESDASIAVSATCQTSSATSEGTCTITATIDYACDVVPTAILRPGTPPRSASSSPPVVDGPSTHSGRSCWTRSCPCGRGRLSQQRGDRGAGWGKLTRRCQNLLARWMARRRPVNSTRSRRCCCRESTFCTNLFQTVPSYGASARNRACGRGACPPCRGRRPRLRRYVTRGVRPHTDSTFSIILPTARA